MPPSCLRSIVLLLGLSSCVVSASKVPAATDASEAGDGAQCTVNEREACYTGPAGSENIGACRAGSRLCQSGRWSDCYQVVPTNEVCNQVDDDCNGTLDEGLQDECGRCEAEPGAAARCVGKDCLRALPSGEGLECLDACCDCVGLVPGRSSASFREILFLCDQPGLCAEAGESDRGWDQFIVGATLLPGASITMRFRAAASPADLSSASWHEATVDADNPSSFRFSHSDAFSEYVEVEVTLNAEGAPGLQLCQLLAIPIQYI